MIIHSFEIILKNALDDSKRSYIHFNAQSEDYFEAWHEALEIAEERLKEKDCVWYIDRISTYR